MTMLVHASVYGRGFYPRGIGPQIFAEGCVSLLHEKYTEGIDTLESPESIHAFLRVMVHHAMLDHLVFYMRRPQEPLEGVDEEGQEIQKLDEAGRDAALRNLGASLVLLAEGDEWARAIENREFLEKAIAEYILTGGPRVLESGLWIQKTLENPKLTPEDVATARKTSARTAYRFMEKDNLAVIKKAKQLAVQKPKHAEARVS